MIMNSPILTHVVCLHSRTDVVNAKINHLFVTEYIESSADRIPNEDKYCLPTCLTKREVYLTYVDELKNAGMRPVSWPTFFRMWKKQFRNVIIPKVSTRTKIRWYKKVVFFSEFSICLPTITPNKVFLLKILINKNNQVAKYFPVVYELIVTTSKNKLLSFTVFVYSFHFCLHVFVITI